MSDGIRRPQAEFASRTAFIRDYTFPVVGARRRRAALSGLRRLVSWSEYDILSAGDLGMRVKDAKPEDLDRLAEIAKRVYEMLREACFRGAKYEVAAIALVARCERLEKQLAVLRRSRR